MKGRAPLEDNWHDILCKALRGLQLDISLLAERSGSSEVAIYSLVEKAILDEQTLVAIAPTLNLNPKALLEIAREPHTKIISGLPKNFQCFTTSYHGMEVHSYLLWNNDTKQAVTFDTGADLAPLLQHLNKYQLQLNAIFLTHGHRDHVGQLQKLIHITGAAAWIGHHDLIPGAQPLSTNYRYQLDNAINLEARPTPGHSPGGTTYLIHGTSPSIAIVGDVIFARSVGGIAPSSYQEALKTIQAKILSLPSETVITPGHGPLSRVYDEKAYNPFFA